MDVIIDRAMERSSLVSFREPVDSLQYLLTFPSNCVVGLCDFHLLLCITVYLLFRMTFREKLLTVIGPEWSGNISQSSSKTPLFLLYYVTDPDTSLRDLLHEERQQSLKSSVLSQFFALHPEVSSVLASAGLHCSGSAIRCHNCLQSPELQKLEVKNVVRLLQFHRLDCLFRRLCMFAAGLGGDDLGDSISDPFASFELHLCQEMQTTKVVVAMEMLYDESAILFVIARLFRQTSSSFQTAGALVDCLFTFEYESDKTEVIEVPDVVAYIRQRISERGASGVLSTSQRSNYRTSSSMSMRLTSGASRQSIELSSQSLGPCDPVMARNTMEEETIHLMSLKLCRICLQRDAEFLITDCGHLVFCNKCHRSSRSCPLCGTRVNDFVRVFPA